MASEFGRNDSSLFPCSHEQMLVAEFPQLVTIMKDQLLMGIMAFGVLVPLQVAFPAVVSLSRLFPPHRYPFPPCDYSFSSVKALKSDLHSL